MSGTPRATVRDFIVKSATFAFDGIPETLQLEWELESATRFEVSFRFQSRNSGYGDRTGQAVNAVITSHDGVVVMEGGRVVSAVLDGVWDMVKETRIGGASTTSSDY